jgi:pseudoazurin
MRKSILLGLLAAVMFASAASAAEVEIKMLNKGADGAMVFEPALVKINPGDSVKFVAADKGHNVESIKGMAPDGTAPVAGKISQDVTVTFDKAGDYGFKCMPHYGMGMVALVVVGTPPNAEAAKAVSHPPLAKKHFAKLFDQASSLAAK